MPGRRNRCGRVSIAGRLEDVDANGVVLHSDGRDLWIPMEAILLVDFNTHGSVPLSPATRAPQGQGEHAAAEPVPASEL